MSIVERTFAVWHCDDCGYEWRVVSRDKKPDRCAEPSCKSRTWDHSVVKIRKKRTVKPKDEIPKIAQPKPQPKPKVKSNISNVAARAIRRMPRVNAVATYQPMTPGHHVTCNCGMCTSRRIGLRS